MDKNQANRGTHASVLHNVNRQLSGARLFLLLLFLAVSLASPQSRISAKAADQSIRGTSSSLTSPQKQAVALNCPACQQALIECLGNGGSNCYADFNVCMANCQ